MKSKKVVAMLLSIVWLLTISTGEVYAKVSLAEIPKDGSDCFFKDGSRGLVRVRRDSSFFCEPEAVEKIIPTEVAQPVLQKIVQQEVPVPQINRYKNLVVLDEQPEMAKDVPTQVAKEDSSGGLAPWVILGTTAIATGLLIKHLAKSKPQALPLTLLPPAGGGLVNPPLGLVNPPLP